MQTHLIILNDVYLDRLYSIFNPYLDLKPPGRAITAVDLILQFEGDCNKKAVQMSIKESVKNAVGVSEINIHCGAQS